jgi:hypothetical protein
MDSRSKLSEAFRQLIEAMRQFLRIAEHCSLKGWPDRTAAIRTAFRLQRLLNEREALRFEKLMGKPEQMHWDSLTRFEERLRTGWSQADEAKMQDGSLVYRDVGREIEECQASMDADALDGPFQAVQRDPDSCRARTSARRGSKS